MYNVHVHSSFLKVHFKLLLQDNLLTHTAILDINTIKDSASVDTRRSRDVAKLNTITDLVIEHSYPYMEYCTL